TTMYGANFQPDSPYADSPWRDEYGGLWDLGPHALSVLVPILGPVVEVTAMAAEPKIHHLLLRHEGGAVSTFHLSIHLPPPAVAWGTELFGAAGRLELPPMTGDVVDAFRAAVARLVANATAGITEDPLDVHAGRAAVAVLAAAHRSAVEGVAVRC